MKKHYIQPATQVLPVCFTNNLCVGSVRGGSVNFDYSGEGDPNDPGMAPI